MDEIYIDEEDRVIDRRTERKEKRSAIDTTVYLAIEISIILFCGFMFWLLWTATIVPVFCVNRMNFLQSCSIFGTVRIVLLSTRGWRRQ